MESARERTSSDQDDLRFARAILPLVSRTFARGIDVLPPSIGESVRLAYLLCRVADTIEDAPGVAPDLRRAWLLRFVSLLTVSTRESALLQEFSSEVAARLAPSSSERAVVEGFPRLHRLLSALDPSRRAGIERWVSELANGMARFVGLQEASGWEARPAQAGSVSADPPAGAGWTSLETCEDLDAYEYYVAGTVGCLLDEIIHGQIPARAGVSRESRERLATAFGLGLQGTNILQDLSDDRRRGWSYLPEEVARRHGTSTVRMTLPGESVAAMNAVREMAERAARHLDQGLEYVLLLPRRAPRVRLFCVWPLLLAVRTLSRLVSSPRVLVERVRIEREEVASLTREATLRCLSNAALRGLYQRERTALAAALQSNPQRSEDHQRGP